MAYTISKYYRNALGLDLRTSDLVRQQGAATDAKNVMYRQTGALSKRNGYQISTDKGDGGAGLFKFNNVEIGTGTITEELLNADDDLHKYTQQTYTVTYTGATNAYYNLHLDKTTGVFLFELYEDAELLFSQNCGTGTGASDTTVAQIKTLVDAETDFAMAISDAGSMPMAFSTITRNINLTSSGTDNYYYTWETIDSPGTYTTPFSDHWSIRNNADFEIASYAQMLDVIYFANGYDDLHKYDGNRVYKAGLPQGAVPTTSGGGVGSLTAGVYKWKYTYEHTDAKQNILTSLETAEATFTSVGTDSKVINVTNLTTSSGYGVAQATVNGNQVGTNTITVTAGHDLKVNDQIYIDDGVTGEVVKREVTVVTATVITIDGDAVNVLTTEELSQTRITLWRTKSDGTLFYIEKEFVNDIQNATTAYTSTNADTALVIDKIDPVKYPGLPPKCRYIDVWRGQLVMTGDRENLTTVYYSDFDGESFPTDQSFVTESRLGGGNSGIKSLDNSLFIFKPRSVITATGDLGTDVFQVDALSDDGVGCVAHATIKEVDGVLWFLGKQGIYTVNRSGTTKMSERIEPKFDLDYTEKRAVAHYWIEKNIYLVSFPVLLTDGSSQKYMDINNSFIMVYDLYRQAWVEWNKVNLLGGIAEYNGDIHTAGFAQDPVVLGSERYSYRLLQQGTQDDYSDHASGIPFSYKSHWEAMGEPSVFKKFLRIKVHALDGTIGDFETDTFSLTVQTEHNYVQLTESDLVMDFSGGAQGWGNSGWGEFIWGESRLDQLSSKLKSGKARALRTILTNSSLQENVLITGYELEIAMPYDPQIKE